MANEIRATMSLTAAKGLLAISRSSDFTVTMAGKHGSAVSQDIPTTSAGTAVTIAAGVVTPGWAFFQNQDSTNYVELGLQVSGTFYAFAKLKPGQAMPLPISSNAIYARANTASVILDVTAIEA